MQNKKIEIYFFLYDASILLNQTRYQINLLQSNTYNYQSK